MKYFVVGMHCSGKQELFNLLIKDKLKCGRLFSNVDINDIRYDFFSEDDIVSIFENKAYLFMKELYEYTPNSYDGLSLYEYDNNDIFILSPDQFNSIPLAQFKEDICLLWLDNTRNFRYERYKEEQRDYNFNERENVEKINMNDFIKNIYESNRIKVLYFNNEDISHVHAILYALVNHKELVPIFEKSYN